MVGNQPPALWHHPLWELAVSSLQPGDVETISYADYGQDAEQHHYALCRLFQPGATSFPLSLHPRKVLSLTRWCGSGDVVDSRDQRLRCFCALALVVGISDGKNEELGESMANNLMIAYESSVFMGLKADALFSIWSSFLHNLQFYIPESELEPAVCHLLLGCINAMNFREPNFDEACLCAHNAFATAAMAHAQSHPGRIDSPWAWVMKATGLNQSNRQWVDHLDQVLIKAEAANHKALIQELQRLREPDPDLVHAWFMRCWDQGLS